MASALLAASSARANEPDWSALAATDIDAVYAETKANHPGMFDPTNPEFPSQLEQARIDALGYASKATNAAGFEAALRRFKAVLNDGHAGAYAALPSEYTPSIRWPGFVAAWRGDAMYVYKSDDTGPAAGSKIESCDGQAIPQLVESKVFAFRDGRKIAGNWWASARLLFVDDGNPFVTLPSSCRFVLDGKEETRELAWSGVPDFYQEWRNASFNGDLLPIGLVERAPGIHWIALPNFQPDEAGVEAYKALFSQLENAQLAIRDGRAVVLDLRYNQGGSSNWGRGVAKRLWGEKQVEAARSGYFAKTQTWWRPTSGNLAQLRSIAALLETQGDQETAGWVKAFIPLFEAAIARGDNYLVEADDPPPPETDASKATPELRAPVYVIVPGQCASACLDAIDTFRLFPNVKLIGAPSSADSTYMEIREAVLPSGMGYGIIPMKMYVNRPRGNGIYYEPDILMNDFDWSTGSFLHRIEADLNNSY